MIRMICALLLLFGWGFGLPQAAEGAGRHKKVLMITSYHQGDCWNDAVVQGVQDILGPLEEVDLAFEHLDMRRNTDDEYAQWVTSFLGSKYRKNPNDLIIVSDDAALGFLLQVRSHLFPRVPVVFCGINNFIPEYISNHRNMTGINETVSIDETIELGLKLFPGTRKIFAVVDEHSAVGRANLDRYREVAGRFAPRVEMGELLNLTDHGAQEVLPSLPRDSLVLRLNNLMDARGKYLSIMESMHIISLESPVPVLSLWDTDLGRGALGGIMVSGREQGRKAGELAARVLAGSHPDHLPVIMESPNMPMFDYGQLRRFGVDVAALPADAVVIGMPESFYSRHKVLIRIVSGLIAFLIVCVAAFLSILIVRRKAEAALRESKTHYQAYVDNAPLGVVLADGNGRYLEVNAETCRITGYSSSELLGRNIMEIMDDETLHSAIKHFERVVTEGRSSAEMSFRTKAGEKRWWNVVAARLSEDRFLGFHEDITSRKQAEGLLIRAGEELAYSEHLWRTAMSNVTDTVVLTDERMDITFVFPNVHFIFGHTEAETMALGNIRNLLPELVFEREKLERYGRLENLHCTLSDKFGNRHDALVGVKKVDFQGYKYLFTVHEATEIMEYTRKLEEAQRRAEAAAIAKSEFLANMSHELRTPFNGIMGMMQLLQTTTLDDEQQRFVTMALKSSERFIQLLSDILDISSIEAGKMTIGAEVLSLEESIDSTLEFFAPGAREKGVSLDCSIEPGIPVRVIGDVVRIRQILFNLVGNAVKFTEKGAVQVLLAPLSPTGGGDVRVMLSVSDTGIGIPEDKIRILFKPFVQADGSYTRSYQGAGLGLAIVRRLVDLMGGNIHIESIVGEGTDIHVVLPFKIPEARASDHTRVAPPPTRTAKNLNILLAEDDRLNRLFMTAMLDKLGHKAIPAKDGREAVDLLTRHDFDCILMDIQMPVMTGIEATKAIRELTTLGPRKNIPIIAVTAHTQPGDRERFLEAGMDDYLPKPVSMDDLEKVLERNVPRD